MKKQLLAALLCLCMILTLFPTLSVPASAKGASGMRLGTDSIINGDAVYFGNYDSNPIQWCVLDSDAGNAIGATDTLSDGSKTIPNSDAMFLLSKYIVNSNVQFSNLNSNSYQGSTVQTWVNTAFAKDINNFGSSEQGVVIATTKSDGAYTSAVNNISFSATTNTLNSDKIFLLSAQEAIDYLGNEGQNLVSKVGNESGSAGEWWLRSPDSTNAAIAGYVENGGNVKSYPSGNMDFGVRPAFNINKNAVLFASAATETASGGKASGSEGADALAKVSTSRPNELKLTLLDSTRNFGVWITEASANSVSFQYFGAKTGGDEYISAVIVDNLGYILYYGRIMKVIDSFGSATINIPADVTLGNNATLKLFNEHYNGDYKTDHASALQSFDHKVTYSLTNLCQATNACPIYVADGETFVASLTANKGYVFPDSVLAPDKISVTVGGVSAKPVSSAEEADTEGEYFYSSECGQIMVAKVNGSVVITVEGLSAISTSPTSLDFGSMTEGYATAPDAQTITIKNNGKDAITDYSITGGGTDYNVTYTSACISAGDTSSFTVRPAANLSAGVYAKTLSIQTAEGSTATVNLSFTVKAKSSGGGSHLPTYYTITASAGKGGSISPSGRNSVEYGSNVTCAIAADKEFKIEDVLVDGVSVGAVSTYTFKSISTAHTISVSFKPLNPFTDVDKKDCFYENIMYAYENGLMTGTGSDAFSPNGTMTREMFVTVLHRLSGDKGSNTNSFSDVPPGAWYENAAAWACAKGIVDGVGSNQFAPENPLTREQLAVMLYNYAKHKGLDVSFSNKTIILSFNDATNISTYAHSALQWACGAGIIKGDGNGNLNPQTFATRAEVAAMLQRFIENVINKVH